MTSNYYYYYYLFITPLRQHSRIQAYRTHNSHESVEFCVYLRRWRPAAHLDEQGRSGPAGETRSPSRSRRTAEVPAAERGTRPTNTTPGQRQCSPPPPPPPCCCTSLYRDTEQYINLIHRETVAAQKTQLMTLRILNYKHNMTTK